MKKINLLLLFFVVLLAYPSFIQAVGTYKADGHNVCFEGLVPCGKVVYVDGSVSGGKCVGGTAKEISCQICHLFVMIDAILDFFLFRIVPPIATLFLVIGGLKLLLISEEPQKVEEIKKFITGVIIGLVIIYGAWVLVGMFFSAIGVAEWTSLSKGWFQIKCVIKLPAP